MRRGLGSFAVGAFLVFSAVGVGKAAAASKGPTWPQISRFIRAELPKIAKEHGYQGQLVDGTYQGLVSNDQGTCLWIRDQAGDAAVQQQAWEDWVPLWQQDAATMSTDGKTYDSILRAFIGRLNIAPWAVPKAKRRKFAKAISYLKLAVEPTDSGSHPKEFYELSAAYSDLAARNCDQSVTDSDLARTDGTSAWAREYKGLTQLAALFGVHVTIRYAPPAPYA
jgi:predicted lipoprotein with Yx(FWY)xxD motif